jgi:bacteriocin leader peptide (microcyclamide/patellamide family)
MCLYELFIPSRAFPVSSLGFSASALSRINPNQATEIPPMNNKSISPNLQHPVDRVPTGQLPSALAELCEAQLDGGIVSSGDPMLCIGPCLCSYDGDDE